MKCKFDVLDGKKTRKCKSSAQEGCDGYCRMHFQKVNLMVGGGEDFHDLDVDLPMPPIEVPINEVVNPVNHHQAESRLSDAVYSYAPSAATTTITTDQYDNLIAQISNLQIQMQHQQLHMQQQLQAVAQAKPGNALNANANANAKITEDRIQRIAKRLYYHNRKNDPRKDEFFKARLEAVGLWHDNGCENGGDNGNAKNANAKNAKGNTNAKIPWQMVRMMTDREFDGLAPEAKTTWMNQANQALIDKMAAKAAAKSQTQA